MERTCAVCGAVFSTNHVRKKTCGKDCSHKLTLFRVREWYRARKAEGPAFVGRKCERQRERYATDPAFAERCRERRRERYHARIAEDPGFAERERERQRERYRARKGRGGATG